MGDTLWGTPAIRAIKKKLPDANIDLLLQKQWMPLFYGNKNLRNLIPYNPRWYHQLLPLLRLSKYCYDHVLIFHSNKDIRRILPCLRTSSIWSHQYPEYDKHGNLIASLPGIPLNRIVQFEKPVHAILRRLALLKVLHVPSDGTQMDIFLNDNQKEEAILFLNKHNIKPKEFIYLNVGGSLPHKQWPTEKFISLGKTILQNTSLSVVFGGGPEDAYRINSIDQQIKKERVVFAKNRTLEENCALIKNAKFIVTPDSGPMHIGFALKVPTISLWPTIGVIESTGSHGEIDPMNGPEFCGPLDIDKSLSFILRGSFLDLNKNVKLHQSLLKPISVEDVWEKIIKVM